VEVRWIMFIEIHTNNDAKKTADFRHFAPCLPRSLSYNRTQ
jgi:hypothetical protein